MFRSLARLRQRAVALVQKSQLRMMPDPVIGPGRIYDVAGLLRDQGIRTVMVVTTEGFMRRGVIPSFTRDLLVHGITSVVFSHVEPDPSVACVEKAASLYVERSCEGIVAIGGGSVMDCAKVAGALAARPGRSALDLVGVMKVRAALPYLVAVPTTAGTGSEVTAAAVITDPERQRKYVVSDFALIPDAAVLDPNLLLGLPPDMTAYTGMDALTHAVEAYINRYGSREARAYAREAVQVIFENLKPSYDDGESAPLRENMLSASYLAGIAFTNNMVGYVHALAHGIGGKYHVQHGLANAVLLPVVLEEYGESAQARLAELAEAIGLDGTSEIQLAEQFISEIRRLSRSMGIPDVLPQIEEADIPRLAVGAEKEGNPAYPVPEIWNRRRFEKVLRKAAGIGQDGGTAGIGQDGGTADIGQDGGAAGIGRADGAAGIGRDDGAAQLGQAVRAPEGSRPDSASRRSQIRITEPAPLLADDGTLAHPGYATSQLLEYGRRAIAASRLRVKEWDYYLVNDGEFALAFTIGDMGYAALVSASMIDFKAGAYVTQSTLGLMPLGRLGLPSSSDSGVTQYADKRAALRFEVAGGLRRLVVNFADFRDGEPLVAEIVLDREPRDSMVIATPWVEDDLAFYYNQKIVAMRAIGSFAIGNRYHEFREDSSFGLLDWGRGVWTRDNTWYWSAAQGIQGGHRFGFNLGYGFGDTTAASENMLFVDGVAHKLGRVDFGIPVADEGAADIAGRFRLMQPWRMSDDEGRLDLVFTPEIDRCDKMDFKVIVSDQHQVFGLFDGTVILDDGSTLEVAGLRGFAEAVHNVY